MTFAAALSSNKGAAGKGQWVMKTKPWTAGEVGAAHGNVTASGRP